jgi:hypothetical protein
MAIVLVANQLWGTLSDKLSRRLCEPPRRRRRHVAIALNGDEMGQQTSTTADHM